MLLVSSFVELISDWESGVVDVEGRDVANVLRTALMIDLRRIAMMFSCLIVELRLLRFVCQALRLPERDLAPHGAEHSMPGHGRILQLPSDFILGTEILV